MLAASSSRRETKPENRSQPKRTGCMSGIFHFFHQHHRHRSRKRLPSGKKENIAVFPTPKPTPPPEKRPPPVDTGEKKPENRNGSPRLTTPGGELRRHSCDMPRSPTLPSEIRRSNSVGLPEVHTTAPALVARLMGLDEVPVSSPRSASEKRRKLLGALEKCDEDLKALKRIIEAVQLVEIRKKTAVELVGPGGFLDGGDFRTEEIKPCLEQPSPVSVLDVISSPSRSRSPNKSKKGNKRENCRGFTVPSVIRSKPVERLVVYPLPPGHHFSEAKDPFIHQIPISEGLAWVSSRDLSSRNRSRHRSSSKAMVESVEEVWKDGIWEWRWEFGRVGVVVAGDILGDLVEEMIAELGVSCCHNNKFSFLPFESCKRRLCF